ncbi:uncharacterized protein BDR25DRAFT_359544 [Lindgomyces ingoldianus]|uniref:Uncharacterized protein n=1 Tax=Lindgomyces ingoldianus TaxID=673940 RepID=A0ACB6QI59_9PLEO|nr:uncharacterized protein BDR25DRAFT_359544 [Lindgomyces ingoldianus]KAF2466638.1 hypothetical protein BDR25DRAFT_359544 [Lindgomyces ingoldianus]
MRTTANSFIRLALNPAAPHPSSSVSYTLSRNTFTGPRPTFCPLTTALGRAHALFVAMERAYVRKTYRRKQKGADLCKKHNLEIGQWGRCTGAGDDAKLEASYLSFNSEASCRTEYQNPSELAVGLELVSSPLPHRFLNPHILLSLSHANRESSQPIKIAQSLWSMSPSPLNSASLPPLQLRCATYHLQIYEPLSSASILIMASRKHSSEALSCSPVYYLPPIILLVSRNKHMYAKVHSSSRAVPVRNKQSSNYSEDKQILFFHYGVTFQVTRCHPGIMRSRLTVSCLEPNVLPSPPASSFIFHDRKRPYPLKTSLLARPPRERHHLQTVNRKTPSIHPITVQGELRFWGAELCNDRANCYRVTEYDMEGIYALSCLRVFSIIFTHIRFSIFALLRFRILISDVVIAKQHPTSRLKIFLNSASQIFSIHCLVEGPLIRTHTVLTFYPLHNLSPIYILYNFLYLKVRRAQFTPLHLQGYMEIHFLIIHRRIIQNIEEGSLHQLKMRTTSNPVLRELIQLCSLLDLASEALFILYVVFRNILLGWQYYILLTTRMMALVQAALDLLEFWPVAASSCLSLVNPHFLPNTIPQI